MNKVYLNLIILLFPFILNAQLKIKGNSNYHIKINGEVGFEGSTCGNSITGGLQWISAKYENNEIHNFIGNYNNDGHGIRETSLDLSTTFTYSKKITSIEIRTLRRTGNSSCNSVRRDHTIPISDFCYSSSFRFIQDYIPPFRDPRPLNIPGFITISIKPTVSLELKNSDHDILGYDQNLIVDPITGIDPNLFNWEYRYFDGNYTSNWERLPEENQNENFLNIKASSFLSRNLINKTIEIRVNMGCNQSIPIAMKLAESAPKITSNSDKESYTSCFESNDGQIRLFFDRPINKSANETINLEIIDEEGQSRSIANIDAFEVDNSYLIKDLKKGNYSLKIVGKYNGETSFSETTVTPYKFKILKNSPVDFTVSKVDVWCYGGADGEITISATGGTKRGYEYQINDGDWIPFSNDSASTQLIKNLSAGQYKIMVRDSNHCVAHVQNIQNNDISLGNVKDPEVVINVPQSPLTLTYTQTQKPTFYGATNGKIVAMINGGTPFNNNTYWFEWKNEQGVVLPATGQYISSSFYISLENIPAGKYYLTIRDKNYDHATTNQNCTVIEDFVEITQPDPLIATIELIKNISCHVANEYGNETDLNPYDGQRDESQDGVLKVNVTGGTPFTGSANAGKPYKYIWKKQSSSGVWQTLANTDATISLLSDGNYAVNVEDANGIVIGIYQNNTLVTPTDVTYYLKQPEQLQVDFQITPVTCIGNDGTINAIVTGGTAPYTYSWTTGDTSSQITNAVPMTYFVTIIDARGCTIQGKAEIVAPITLTVEENISPLLCYNAANASIALQVNGSVGPYTYLWNTGETTKDITNLKAGTYQVTITDGQGCNYVYNYTIANPEEFKIDLGPDRTLCFGQTIELDATVYNATIVSYEWKNEQGNIISNSAKIIVDTANQYTVSAITANGCIITDSIEVTYADVEIDAEFLLTTQAFVNQDVILVNVSNPKGQTTDWFVNSSEIKVVNKNDDYITLNFNKIGTYNIALKQTQGDCFMIYNKEIIVEANTNAYNPENTNASFVKEFVVTPNPSNGNFEVKVELERESAIKLRLFTAAGQLAQTEKKSVTATKHLITYNTQLSAGTYILVLETTFQTLTKKIIIY